MKNDATQIQAGRSSLEGLAPGPLARHEAFAEAERCLYCFDAPCIHACPTGIDVPGFIKKIAARNTQSAARLILEANPLGESCARVCPTEALCEGACVLNRRDGRPIPIGRLQRFAVEEARASGRDLVQCAPRRRTESVAIVGGGPAGLACAAELARLGIRAVVFEKEALAGGLNTYGVAPYKWGVEDSLAEIERIRRLGVEIRTGVEIGRDVSADELRRDFSCVFLAIGLYRVRRLGIPGEDAAGVVDAIEFIKGERNGRAVEWAANRRVAVIGGGNTAMDAAIAAARSGAAEVVILYRRGEAELPAYPSEVKRAKLAGCRFVFHAVPSAIELQDGRARAIRLAPVEQAAVGTVHPIVPCDLVIRAIGQSVDRSAVERLFPGLAWNADGTIQRDPATGQTNLAGVFAGGDCANGGREVVHAVAEGVRAARGIVAWLTGRAVESPVQPSRLGSADGGRCAGIGAREVKGLPQGITGQAEYALKGTCGHG